MAGCQVTSWTQAVPAVGIEPTPSRLQRDARPSSCTGKIRASGGSRTHTFRFTRAALGRLSLAGSWPMCRAGVEPAQPKRVGYGHLGSPMPSRHVKSVLRDSNPPGRFGRPAPAPIGQGARKDPAVHTGVEPVPLPRQSTVQSRYTNAPSKFTQRSRKKAEQHQTPASPKLAEKFDDRHSRPLTPCAEASAHGVCRLLSVSYIWPLVLCHQRTQEERRDVAAWFAAREDFFRGSFSGLLDSLLPTAQVRARIVSAATRRRSRRVRRFC